MLFSYAVRAVYVESCTMFTRGGVTNNPLYAIATGARDLRARELVLGASEKSSVDVQLEQFALAWGMAMSEGAGQDELTIRIIGKDAEARWEL